MPAALAEVFGLSLEEQPLEEAGKVALRALEGPAGQQASRTSPPDRERSA
ncbi:Hypothetical predicted protein [Podarcis lilfordi]|uniref:Uncharacterized protein n=1 Tax=Podarcis lilfordi TaxID=74358 RepID=A0AA35K695_9SAUR|nr:Hypothetical predicted protein [Podarcis lilfordi]